MAKIGRNWPKSKRLIWSDYFNETRSTQPIDAKLWKKLCLWFMFNIKIIQHQAPPYQRSKILEIFKISLKYHILKCLIYDISNTLNVTDVRVTQNIRYLKCLNYLKFVWKDFDIFNFYIEIFLEYYIWNIWFYFISILI